MNDELDEILLEQYHSVKRSKKFYKRMKKLMPTERLLIVGEDMAEKKMEFYASMINNKLLLEKKHKKKKQKDPDVLARNPVYEWYRSALYLTVFGYKFFMKSAEQYMSYFKKDKNENGKEH